MKTDSFKVKISKSEMNKIAKGAKQVLREPILKALLNQSILTETQLETLLIDLVVEDRSGGHIPYETKATIRSRDSSKSKGVSRGSFNRTLKQSRRNVTKCLYTMLLLAYLGLFDFTIFRPFEEIAARIGDYRKIRDILGGKADLTSEDIESYRAAEKTILTALDDISSPLVLKSELSRRNTDTETESIKG